MEAISGQGCSVEREIYGEHSKEVAKVGQMNRLFQANPATRLQSPNYFEIRAINCASPQCFYLTKQQTAISLAGNSVILRPLVRFEKRKE